MVDELVHVALERPIAASGVGIEPTARLDGEVRRFLPCGNGKVPCGLHHDATLAAHPRDEGRPSRVVVAPAGLTLLAATTRPAAQRLSPTPLCLALAASGMVEVVCFDSALALAL